MAFEIINKKKFNEYIKKYECNIYDLRSQAEYRKWHYKNAIWMDVDDYIGEIKKNDKAKILIFYCERGGVSMMAARNADKLGYNAKSIVGGYRTILD